jgi:hypothetical protein
VHRSADPAPGASRRPHRLPGSLGRAVLWLTLAGLPAGAAAQVGYSPGHSPYRDIRKGHMVTPIFGQFGGSGGRFEIGPHDGQIYGLRYDVRTGSAVQLGLGVSHATLSRLIVDPFVELANRTSGPVDQSVTFAELNLQLNLTGGKSWHRLAPFVGAGAGLTFSTSTPQDTSKYRFGKKFYVAPSAGVRFFVTDRISLRGEARAVFWKLKYPTTFQDEPALEPGVPPDHSNAVITDGRLSEWTTSSWLLVGMGIGFSP